MKKNIIVYLLLGLAVLLFILSYFAGRQGDIKIPEKEQADLIKTSLSVNGQTYQTEVPAGATVYDMLALLASTTKLTFHASLFSGIGYFVDEINGVKNTLNTYWFYYINNASADVGISSYVLKPDDNITWKFESKM